MQTTLPSAELYRLLRLVQKTIPLRPSRPEYASIVLECKQGRLQVATLSAAQTTLAHCMSVGELDGTIMVFPDVLTGITEQLKDGYVTLSIQDGKLDYSFKTGLAEGRYSFPGFKSSEVEFGIPEIGDCLYSYRFTLDDWEKAKKVVKHRAKDVAYFPFTEIYFCVKDGTAYFGATDKVHAAIVTANAWGIDGESLLPSRLFDLKVPSQKLKGKKGVEQFVTLGIHEKHVTFEADGLLTVVDRPIANYPATIIDFHRSNTPPLYAVDRRMVVGMIETMVKQYGHTEGQRYFQLQANKLDGVLTVSILNESGVTARSDIPASVYSDSTMYLNPSLALAGLKSIPSKEVVIRCAKNCFAASGLSGDYSFALGQIMAPTFKNATPTPQPKPEEPVSSTRKMLNEYRARRADRLALLSGSHA